MDVQHLRAFRSVVATGSVRAAADVLGYSPSAISQQVSGLQRSAGIPLLTRVGRGLEPTPAGVALARRVDGLLGELGDLDTFLRGLREGKQSALALGYVHSLGSTWLPHIVGPLVEEYPDVRVDLFVSDHFDVGRRPRPEIQFVVTPRGFEPPSGYTLRMLGEDPYVAVLPEQHRLAGEDSISLAELAGESWVDNDPAHGSCRQVLLDACAAAGFRPRFRIEAHDYATALSLVSTRLGVSVMPSLGARHLPDGLVPVPVTQPEPVRAIGALVREDSAATELVQRTLELAAIAAREEGRSPQR